MEKALSLNNVATRKLKAAKERLNLQWGDQIPHQDILRKSKVVFDIGLAQSGQRDRHRDIYLANQSSAVDSLTSGRFLEDTFHYAAGPALAYGQSVGILPIAGILSPDHFNLRFKWISWQIFCTFLMMTGGFVLAFMSMYRIVDSGISVSKFGACVFYSANVLIVILFLLLARNWSNVISTVSAAEMTSIFRPHVGRHWSLRKKFSLCSCIFLSISAFEHSLCIMSYITTAWTCSDQHTKVKQYYTTTYKQIFDYFEFSPWSAVILQIWNIQATMLWNFEDLFIILVSYYLADRFYKLNDHLVMEKGRHSSKEFWDSARNQYVILTQVVRKMDSGINKIIALSFATNLYIICHQMFNSLSIETNTQAEVCSKKKKALFWPNFLSSVYFYFSFGFLLVRFLLVSLAASYVHVASKSPKALLHALSSQHFCIEAQRFLDHVTTEKVGLTGFRLFTVTRGLILKIAGTVITYELVLLQFNTPAVRLSTNVTIFTKDLTKNFTITI